MSQDSNSGDDPQDFLRRLFDQAGFSFSGDSLKDVLGQVQRSFAQFNSQSGLNTEQMTSAVRQAVAASGPDPAITYQQQREVGEAARLAEMWLDDITEMTRTTIPAVGMSRASWVEETVGSWQIVVSPIISSLAEAMSKVVGAGPELGDDELAQIGKFLAPMMKNAAGTMYAIQLSNSIAKLATQTLTGSEIGLELFETPKVVLLPTNIAEATEGFGLSHEDILIYLTVREAARQRLFNSVGWLGPQLLAMVKHYASKIQIDTTAITEAFDPQQFSLDTDPEELSEIGERLSGRLFQPTRSQEQEEIVERLETLLALIEGWVDEVSSLAIAPWMRERSDQLIEMVRRRRAVEAPGSQTLNALVGMELSPRRVRDAANLWAALTQKRGSAGRDHVWSHPDLIPTAEDFADPMGFAAGDRELAESDEMDVALRQLLDEETGEDRKND